MLGLTAPDGSDDTAQFLVDETLKLEIHVTEDDAFLHLRATVGTVPAEMRQAKAMEIAIANYNGAMTGGGALGLHPESGEVMLFLTIPCDAITASLLEPIVSRFIDAAMVWVDRCQAPSEIPGEAATESTDRPAAAGAWMRI